MATFNVSVPLPLAITVVTQLVKQRLGRLSVDEWKTRALQSLPHHIGEAFVLERRIFAVEICYS